MKYLAILLLLLMGCATTPSGYSCTATALTPSSNKDVLLEAHKISYFVRAESAGQAKDFVKSFDPTVNSVTCEAYD